jgi:nucleoside-diphosphate-sugar epimerase
VSRVKTALVTGASGFIGRPLCGKLAAGSVRVLALARRPCSGSWDAFFPCDLASEPIPADALQGVDTVFHLASRVHELGDGKEAVGHYYRTNVEGTRRLLEAAVSAGVSRVVFLSSVKAAGEGDDTLTDESLAPRPVSAYGKSKLEAEALVNEARECFGLATTVLRLPLVYGAGVRGNLGEMIEAIGSRRFPPIAECGNKRSMVHVEDVVAAAVLAAESDVASGRLYYLTDGRDYSTRELYDLIRSAIGQPPARWSIPVAALRVMAKLGDTAHGILKIRPSLDSSRLAKLIGSARYDATRIRNELGFTPRHSFESALPGMIAALGLEADPASVVEPRA